MRGTLAAGSARSAPTIAPACCSRRTWNGSPVRWFELDAAVMEVVESLRSVHWRFDPGESIRQRIIATPGLDPRLFALLSRIVIATTPHAQTDAANAVIPKLLAERPVGASLRTASAVVAALTPGGVPVDDPTLARRFGVSERMIQRALRSTLVQGPTWVGRWVRRRRVRGCCHRPTRPTSPPYVRSLRRLQDS